MPADSPTTFVTSTELLARLRTSSEPTAWQAYADRYRPLVVGYATKLGLSHADAEDVAQHIFTEFYSGLRDGRYEPAKGRLRSWLFGIAQRQVMNWCRRRGRDETPLANVRDGTELLAGLEDEDRLAALWDEQWREAVVQRCLTMIRGEVEERTFLAFRLLVWQGWPASRVAEHIGANAGTVFGAKQRVMKRLRELIPLVEAEL